VLDPRVSAKPFLYTYNTRASVVAQLAMPTGQTIAYARDAEGRLLSTTLSGTAHQTLATHAYTYDLAGQRTTATTASATTAYTYDALRQLATATETPAGTGQTPTREFAYAYDPIGNRLTAATAAETTTYTANSVNQYTAIVSQISNSQISDTPTYDANGNTTTLPSGLVLDYDEENRLVSAATLTAREEYTYDGLGRRVERRTFTASTGLTAPATTTRYVYDGWRVLEELTSTQSSPFTLHSSYTRGLDLSGTLEGAGGIGGLLAMTRDPAGSATSAYYFHDGNGNVSTLVSASDALLASYTYTPFGDTLTASGTWASVNAYRFSAKECDAFTSLYYYGLRYYNPSTGRWLSRDPIAEKGGPNLYGMVRNSPVNQWDLLGLAGESLPIEPYLAGYNLTMMQPIFVYPEKKQQDCSSGFCVVGDTIQTWYGGAFEMLGIEHVDITYNGQVIYVGRGGAASRLNAEYKKTRSSYPQSRRSDGTMRFGDKAGCLKCKDATDADILNCLRKRPPSAGRNCQGDVQDATGDCCLSGFRTFTSTFFGWLD